MTDTNGKREKAAETRQRILDAAARLFREAGYASVSLRGIAEAADMKAGSVYYHFKSKEEIILEVLNIGIERVCEAVELTFEEMRETSSASDLISSGVRAHLQTLLRNTDYTSANVRIYGQVPENIRQDALVVRRKYEALWDEILSAAKAAGGIRPDVNLHIFRLMLIGSLNATLEWFDPDQGSVEGLADNYTRIFTNGLMGE